MSSSPVVEGHGREARARQLWRNALPDRAIDDLRELAGGEVNATYRVRSGEEAFVLRYQLAAPADWHPSVEGQVAALALARDAGVPVPEVVFSSPEVLIYHYIPGTMPTEDRTDPILAFQAGALHGRLHRIRGTGIGPVQADGSSPDWPEESAIREVPSWADRLSRHPSSPMAPEEVEEAASLVLDHWSPQNHRLLHGDASIWNTLVDSDRVAAIIDFDDAWYGDPAGDMAWWWWSCPATADAFVAGCAAENQPTEPLTLWLFRLRHLLGIGAGLVDTALVDRTRRAADLLSVALDQVRRL
jgi:aminoglycoside phosphotransferase (APT) family kinase protein